MTHFLPVFNVLFSSADPDAVLISNLSAMPFWLDHTHCASVEGFLMAIMFPPYDARHQRALGLAGVAAKRLGRKARRKFVWWYGRRLKFGSDAHEALIERAIRAKFEQNRAAMGALMRTAGKRLVHDVGRPDSPRTCLRREVLCDILTRLRDDELPRWPRGSEEKPLELRVRFVPRTRRFVASLRNSRGEDRWVSEASSEGLAIGQTLEWSCRAHDQLFIRLVEESPHGS